VTYSLLPAVNATNSCSMIMLTCVHACMHVCLYARMLVCTYACMHVCFYACMLVCTYVRRNLRVDMHVSKHPIGSFYGSLLNPRQNGFEWTVIGFRHYPHRSAEWPCSLHPEINFYSAHVQRMTERKTGAGADRQKHAPPTNAQSGQLPVVRAPG